MMSQLAASIVLSLSFCQAQTEPLAFEVVSVKPNHSGSGNSHTNTTKGLVTMENRTLKGIIERAYDVRDFSFSGPAWLETERFDISAKLPAGSTSKQYPPMLQTLLADRFKLTVHWEQKVLPGYALVVAKKPVKLEENAGNDGQSDNTGTGRIEAKNTTMSHFADVLGSQVNQPVQDQTALPGKYNMKLEFTPEDSAVDKGEDPASKPTLFTALQEQLGLQLRPQKVAIKILIVDHIEKVPTEN